jgi:hypothetical protein
MKNIDLYMNEVVSISDRIYIHIYIYADYSVSQGSVPYLLGYLSRNCEKPYKNEILSSE